MLTLTDFYYLDYMTQPERRGSPVFRHRAASTGSRRRSQRLDLSQIEDPLIAQAGAASHQSRVQTPPPEQIPATESAQTSPRAARTAQHKHKRSLTPPPLVTREPETSDGSSDEDDGLEDADESNLLLHNRVYALAEKFDVPALKDIARAKFEMAMACYYDSPQLADAIEEVYSSTVDTDRGLRDVVLQAFRSHPQLANTKDIFEVIKTTPTLAFELFKVERGIPI